MGETNSARHPGHRVLAWPGLWNLVAGLFCAPIAILIVQTLAFRWFFPQVLPEEWRVGAFFEVIGRSEVRSAVWSSLLVGSLTVLLSLLVGVPAAWYLAMRARRSRIVIVSLLIVPQLLPPLTAGMGLSVAFLRIGFSGGLLPVVLAHSVPVLPFVIGISAVTFSRLDAGYVRVAAGLGMSPAVRWRQVVWPLTRLGVGLAAYVGFVVSWSQYLLTLFVGRGQVVTLPMLVLSTGSGGNLSLFAALALIMSVVPMVLFVFFRRGPQSV